MEEQDPDMAKLRPIADRLDDELLASSGLCRHHFSVGYSVTRSLRGHKMLKLIVYLNHRRTAKIDNLATSYSTFEGVSVEWKALGRIVPA